MVSFVRESIHCSAVGNELSPCCKHPRSHIAHRGNYTGSPVSQTPEEPKHREAIEIPTRMQEQFRIVTKISPGPKRACAGRKRPAPVDLHHQTKIYLLIMLVSMGQAWAEGQRQQSLQLFRITLKRQTLCLWDPGLTDDF